MRGGQPLRVAIDATNLHGGGGVTHLVELLHATDPEALRIERVVVFGPTTLLRQLPQRHWIERVHHPRLDRSLLHRLLWQATRLDAELKAHRCDVLLVPGGARGGRFRPYVAMSRNLLPFDLASRARYRGTWMGVRLALLTRVQARVFRRADGVIFLTQTARRYVERVTGPLSGRVRVIPHGVSDRFRRAPAAQQPLSRYSMTRPFRVLYVSIIDLYKHQDTVARAVASLRQDNLPLQLDLVGPAYPPAYHRLEQTLAAVDPERRFVTYRPAVPHADLPALYAAADAFVFASSCENLPNVLLEAMAAGVPIACSNRNVMPEVLGDGGVYFDPEDVADVARAIRTLAEDVELRTTLSARAYRNAAAYTWERCARDTFGFLAEVAGLQLS